MIPKLIAAAALGAALVGPAFAQPQQGQQTQPSGQQRQQGQSQQQAMGQERLRQQLTQAGFRDVQILDTAYLVQARTQDGSVVLILQLQLPCGLMPAATFARTPRLSWPE